MSKGFKSLKGQLILDGGNLAGSFFNRTVLLLCEHSPEGAFGLVLNRQSDNNVGDMLVADLPEKLREQDLYVGGPVQPSALSFLHSDLFLPSANVMPNLSLGHSLDDLLELGGSFSITQRIRVFAGYSGWGPGQLDDEMKRSSWLVHHTKLEHVFDVKPQQLWQHVMVEKGGIHRLMAQAPDDLSRN
ncbi:MAG: YqgE/AlgH family protein [Pedosphaera sp.]|nr:YqgE/AlgH family protein [Pedosphaera sp.]MSU43298.1 YqgE/AlgH family protein [Pedosphaera sp.]